jgi:hypothetical protein
MPPSTMTLIRVRAEFGLLADGLARLVGGVDLEAPPVAVTAGAGERCTGRQYARARDQAAIAGVLEGEDDLVVGAAVAEGCHAFGQGALGVRARLQKKDLARIAPHVLGGGARAVAGDVDVGVDEAGRERQGAEVAHLVGVGRQRVNGPNRGDAALPHEHGCSVERALGGEDALSAKQQRPHCTVSVS